MDDWIIRLVNEAGYWGVALLMFLETVFPPVPSEVIMTVAGVSAARGNMTFGGVVMSGTAGAMLGNYLWFLLAIKFGKERLKSFLEKHGRWLTLHWTEVEQGQALFEKYGSTIVMVARMLPTLRSLISIPAGIFNMSHCRFI
ncbi:MAG: DedA family protein, partial [Sphingorhabdus sp.]